MKLKKCLKNAFEMVIHSKIRSWLTILGIVIGVGAVVAIMSLGSGMEQTVTRQLDDLGADILTLTAGTQRAIGNIMIRQPTTGTNTGNTGGGGGGRTAVTTTNTSDSPVLDNKDVQALRTVLGIELIDTNIRGSVRIEHLGKTGSVTLTGVDQTTWSRITNLKVKEGRLLDSADSNVIVIGGKLANTYFDEPLRINNMLTISGRSFRIVGILDDTTTNIYMPLQMSYEVLDDKTRGEYDTIIMKVKDVNKINETTKEAEEKLMISRMVTENNKDFNIVSNIQTQETRNEMMQAIQTFLLAIAAVSLIVGAVGIANTMYTSVLEKTKEIGIMKAIGAKNKDILLIFVLNSAIIGLIGGILGVFFGMILSNLLPALTSEIRFMSGEIIISTEAIIIALIVSTIVGIISGIIPAYKASRLKPVDALRHE